MNNTNRAFNRACSLLAGLVDLALGAAAIDVGSSPKAGSAWTDGAPAVRRNLAVFFASAPLAVTTLDG